MSVIHMNKLEALSRLKSFENDHQINRGFNCIDFEFGTPGQNPNLLKNTQVAGVYLMYYDKDNDVEIEIRVKPRVSLKK